MTSHNNINHLKKLGKESSTFYFKQFKVEDGLSTMKVGTDAVLLGVIAEVPGAKNILEIGAGCGLISLILAQRSRGRINAIEIDQESVIQAKENVRNSPWKDRINIIHCSLQNYIHQTDKKFDLVISNPPYFSRSLKSISSKRNISRHDDYLSFDELIEGSSELMLPDASLWIILPAKESSKFLEIAGRSGFFIHYLLKIATKKGSAFRRTILQLKKAVPEKVIEKTLAIKNEDNAFTQEYIDLTKEFYIDF